MIDLVNTPQVFTEVPTKRVGKTAAGRPMDWFTNEQVHKGVWREEEIVPAISSLTRPITIYRGSRKTNLIVYDWHGDKQTFCPPMWWDLAIGMSNTWYTEQENKGGNGRERYWNPW